MDGIINNKTNILNSNSMTIVALSSATISVGH